MTHAEKTRWPPTEASTPIGQFADFATLYCQSPATMCDTATNRETTYVVDVMYPREATANQRVMNPPSNEANAAQLHPDQGPNNKHYARKRTCDFPAIRHPQLERQAWPVPTRCGTTTLSQNVTSKPERLMFDNMSNL